MRILIDNYGVKSHWLVAIEYTKAEKKELANMIKNLKLQYFSDGYDKLTKKEFAQYIYRGTRKSFLSYAKKHKLEVVK